MLLKTILNYLRFTVLLSRTDEGSQIKRHKSFLCKCKLDASACNDKQRWNDDKCRCEWKELIDTGKCCNGFIWNPSICECDKSCDVAEYLDYANSRCRKRLNKLVLECEDEMLNTTDTISIAGKKVKCKNNCLIYITIIVLSIMCLILLAIVFISCYYYTKYWVKKEYSMP